MKKWAFRSKRPRSCDNAKLSNYMKINKTRRLIINGVWNAPIITAISLPAHAQTSMCSVTNLVGRWLYEGTTGNGINLHADGRSDAGLGGGRWSVDGTKINISYDGFDHVIVGELLQNCTRIEGIEYNQCCPDVDPNPTAVVLVKAP